MITNVGTPPHDTHADLDPKLTVIPVIASVQVVVPLSTKWNRPISMTTRIGLGFLLELLALASAAIIEMVRLRLIRNAGLIDKWNADPNPDKSYTGGW